MKLKINFLQDYVNYRFEVISMKSMITWLLLIEGLTLIIGFFSGIFEVLILSFVLSSCFIFFCLLTFFFTKNQKSMTFLLKGVFVNLLSLVLLFLGYFCIVMNSQFNLGLFITVLMVYLLYDLALFYSAIRRITNGYYSKYSMTESHGGESIWPLIFAGGGYIIAAIWLRDIGSDAAFVILGLSIISISILVGIGNTFILRFYYYSKYRLEQYEG